MNEISFILNFSHRAMYGYYISGRDYRIHYLINPLDLNCAHWLFINSYLENRNDNCKCFAIWLDKKEMMFVIIGFMFLSVK